MHFMTYIQSDLKANGMFQRINAIFRFLQFNRQVCNGLQKKKTEERKPAINTRLKVSRELFLFKN